MSESERALRTIVSENIGVACPTKMTFYSEVEGEMVEAGIDFRTFFIGIGEDHVAEVIIHKDALMELRRRD